MEKTITMDQLLAEYGAAVLNLKGAQAKVEQLERILNQAQAQQAQAQQAQIEPPKESTIKEEKEPKQEDKK